QRFGGQKGSVAIEGDVVERADGRGDGRPILADHGRPDSGHGLEQAGADVNAPHAPDGVVGIEDVSGPVDGQSLIVSQAAGGGGSAVDGKGVGAVAPRGDERAARTDLHDPAAATVVEVAVAVEGQGAKRAGVVAAGRRLVEGGDDAGGAIDAANAAAAVVDEIDVAVRIER